MSLFQNLSNEGLEEAGDRVGGFTVFESDTYTGTIKALYAGKAANSNAMSITLHLDLGGKEYRETFWVSNKDGQNFYHPKDGQGNRDTTKRNPLPGFTHIDDLCLMTTDKPLSQQATEEKIMNIYNFDEKKEVATAVQMIMEPLGKTVTLGILKQTVDKTAKDAAGVYQPTGETREENVTDKVFHDPSGLTVTEAKNGVKTPEFLNKWLSKNKGQTRDKTTKNVQGGQSGRPSGGPPQAAPQSGERQSSLFKKP